MGYAQIKSLFTSLIIILERKRKRGKYGKNSDIGGYTLRSLIDNKSIKNNDDLKFIKVFAIIASISTILAILTVLRTDCAHNYEISIYTTYPLYFWAFIIISIFIGQMILVTFSLNSPLYNKSSNFWIFAFLIILITNIILLFMPFIRGYTVYGRGDVLTHLGYIKDILTTASIGVKNYYPLDHILAVAFYYVTNINVEKVVNIIPPVFFLFYVLSIYLLLNQIFKSKIEIILVLAFISMLLFSNDNLVFAPSAQSFFFLPFVLYIYFKCRNSKHSLELNLVLLILLFFMVFFHPLTELFLILIFLILEFCLFIYQQMDGINVCEIQYLCSRRSSGIIVTSFATFFMWYFSFTAITNDVHKVTNALFFGSENTQAKIYAELITQTQPDFYNLAKVIASNYGQIIILMIVSIFLFLYFFNIWIRSSKRDELNFFHFFFLIATMIFIFLSIIFFFNDLIINFGRFSKYTLFFSSIFVGISFSSLFNKYKLSISRQLFIFMSLSIILICLLYFSTFNLYLSPIIKSPNQQVTKNEITGVTWFFDHRNDNMSIQEFGISHVRYHDAIYGRTIPTKNMNYNAIPIDHFNYTNKTSFGSYERVNKYMLLTTLGRLYYPELYPEYEKYWRFTPDDFNNFENDYTVSQIYDNRGLNVYFVNGHYS